MSAPQSQPKRSSQQTSAHSIVFSTLGESLLLKYMREFYENVLDLQEQANHLYYAQLRIDKEQQEQEQHIVEQQIQLDDTPFTKVNIGSSVYHKSSNSPDKKSADSEQRTSPQQPLAELSCDIIRNRLMNRLASYSSNALRISDEFAVYYAEAEYMMVALADEVYLHRYWIKQQEWDNSLLELALYNSYKAGQGIFERIDRIMQRQRTHTNIELAKVYLAGLLLGFEGQFRTTGSVHHQQAEQLTAALADYRHRLFVYIFGKIPQEFSEEFRNNLSIFSHERLYVPEPSQVQFLPPMRRWLWSIVIVLAGLLILAHIVWIYLSRDVKNQITSMNQTKTGGSATSPPPIQSPLPKSESKEGITVRGKVVNTDGEPLEAKITIENLSQNTVLERTKSNVNGTFEITLPKKEYIGYSFEKTGYYPISRHVCPENDDSFPKQLSFPQSTIKMYTIEELRDEQRSIIITNAFFDFNKSRLNPKSFPELNRIATVLKRYKTLKTEISGHTDNVGRESYNLSLSLARASAVKSYLVAQGCNPTLIVVKGYGSKKRIEKSNDPKEQEVNRRTEIRFLR